MSASRCTGAGSAMGVVVDLGEHLHVATIEGLAFGQALMDAPLKVPGAMGHGSVVHRGPRLRYWQPRRIAAALL